MSSYRLHNNTQTISRGPLALVAGQAHRSALEGTGLFISDTDGNTVAVQRHQGAIWPIWQQHPAQLQLFIETTTPARPEWYCRLLLLIVELNDDGQNELPHHSNTKQKATP